MSKRKSSNTEYEAPVILAFVFIIVLIFSGGFFVIYEAVYSAQGPVKYEEGGEHIEVQGDQREGQVISLNRRSNVVDIEKADGVKYMKLRVEKYYTNDLLIEDGEGKASVDVLSKESIVREMEGRKSSIYLENKNDKETGIIVVEPIEVEMEWYVKELPFYGVLFSLILLLILGIDYVLYSFGFVMPIGKRV